MVSALQSQAVEVKRVMSSPVLITDWCCYHGLGSLCLLVSRVAVFEKKI